MPREVQIKVVIMNHNQRESAEALYLGLSDVFDTSLFDSGSLAEEVSAHTTHKFENIYWTGCWNEGMSLFGHADVLWILGGDVNLLNSPMDYKRCIEATMPFGCWSPAVCGRSRDFMRSEKVGENLLEVYNVEGICLAVSKSVMLECKPLPIGSPTGWGHDVWMSYRARKIGLSNFIDGRVKVEHPPLAGYDEEIARVDMIRMFERLLGERWRSEAHEESSTFEYNTIREICAR
jgi:hypothetical protein